MNKKQLYRIYEIISHVKMEDKKQNEIKNVFCNNKFSFIENKIENNVFLIILNNPPINSINLQLILELEKCLQIAFLNNSIESIVLTGSNNRFCGGADLNLFKSSTTKSEIVEYITKCNNVINVIENSKKPIVAAIDGFALGGGLEIAIACHFRICTPNTKLALPELKLGLIPGFGGTQRLPRLVGIQKAIEMIMFSKEIKGKEAKKIGLVDEIISQDQLLQYAINISLMLINKNLSRTLKLTEKINDIETSKKIIEFARKEVMKLSYRIPHPLAALNSIEAGITTFIENGYNGLEKEKEEFLKLVSSTTTKSMIHIFFSSKQSSKIPNITDIGLKPRNIKNIAIIGGILFL